MMNISNQDKWSTTCLVLLVAFVVIVISLVLVKCYSPGNVGMVRYVVVKEDCPTK